VEWLKVEALSLNPSIAKKRRRISSLENVYEAMHI
jgi:hypothetical protein